MSWCQVFQSRGTTKVTSLGGHLVESEKGTQHSVMRSSHYRSGAKPMVKFPWLRPGDFLLYLYLHNDFRHILGGCSPLDVNASSERRKHIILYHIPVTRPYVLSCQAS